VKRNALIAALLLATRGRRVRRFDIRRWSRAVDQDSGRRSERSSRRPPITISVQPLARTDRSRSCPGVHSFGAPEFRDGRRVGIQSRATFRTRESRPDVQCSGNHADLAGRAHCRRADCLRSGLVSRSPHLAAKPDGRRRFPRRRRARRGVRGAAVRDSVRAISRDNLHDRQTHTVSAQPEVRRRARSPRRSRRPAPCRRRAPALSRRPHWPR
jgi:hypothetical protein